MRYQPMIHFIISDEPTDKTDAELIALLESTGASIALNVVKDHLKDKEVKRIIVGPNFINIVTQ